MKRFHVHVHVDDLSKSIGFYSKLFAAEPARVEADYAKWMLDDPAELAEMKARAQSVDMALLDEGQTTCCYARSEKHWVTDPQGISWEHFHTLASIPVFREAAPAAAAAGCSCTPKPAGADPAKESAEGAAACCAPTPRGKTIGVPVKSASSCC